MTYHDHSWVDDFLDALIKCEPNPLVHEHLDDAMLWLQGRDTEQYRLINVALEQRGVATALAERQLILLFEKIFFLPGSTPYQQLGLVRGVTDEDAKIRYRRLLGIYHPDRGMGDEAWRNEHTEKLNRAYKDIKDDLALDHAIEIEVAPAGAESAGTDEYGEVGKESFGPSSETIARWRRSLGSEAQFRMRAFAALFGLAVLTLYYIYTTNSGIEVEFGSFRNPESTGVKTQDLSQAVVEVSVGSDAETLDSDVVLHQTSVISPDPNSLTDEQQDALSANTQKEDGHAVMPLSPPPIAALQAKPNTVTTSDTLNTSPAADNSPTTEAEVSWAGISPNSDMAAIAPPVAEPALPISPPPVFEDETNKLADRAAKLLTDAIVRESVDHGESVRPQLYAEQEEEPALPTEPPPAVALPIRTIERESTESAKSLTTNEQAPEQHAVDRANGPQNAEIGESKRPLETGKVTQAFGQNADAADDKKDVTTHLANRNTTAADARVVSEEATSDITVPNRQKRTTEVERAFVPSEIATSSPPSRPLQNRVILPTSVRPSAKPRRKWWQREIKEEAALPLAPPPVESDTKN